MCRQILRKFPRMKVLVNEFGCSRAVSLVHAYGRQDFNRQSAGMQTCQESSFVCVIVCAVEIPGSE